MSPAHRSFADPYGKIYPSYFSSAEGSERNSASFLLFLFHGTEFRVVFSSAEGFGTEFREFLFHGTAGIPSELTISSVYSVFRGIIFLSEIPNPMYTPTPFQYHHVQSFGGRSS
jgi:hypothetical protein